MTMTETKTYKKTNTKTKTHRHRQIQSAFQDPMYVNFFKRRGFKDLKYYIGCLLIINQLINLRYKSKEVQAHLKTFTNLE